jgi:hypothetical protein
MTSLSRRFLRYAVITSLAFASASATLAQAPTPPGDSKAANGPVPKYDLVASKKHDGNLYILTVHNAGSQIMPAGKVDVIELVPVGLTITSFPAAPWSCSGTLPIVGPDSFTCSFHVPPGGIPANSNLPPLLLKSEGKPECPNCMRVRLYLGDNPKPVNEVDMKNNVSCTK